MRTIIAIVILCIGLVAVSAQQPKSAPKADVISEAIKAEVDASAAFDTAKANLDAARANVRAVLFREMAEAGVKPTECATDNNPFACVSRDPKTGAWLFTPKKAETVKATPK